MAAVSRPLRLILDARSTIWLSVSPISSDGASSCVARSQEIHSAASASVEDRSNGVGILFVGLFSVMD